MNLPGHRHAYTSVPRETWDNNCKPGRNNYKLVEVWFEVHLERQSITYCMYTNREMLICKTNNRD